MRELRFVTEEKKGLFKTNIIDVSLTDNVRFYSLKFNKKPDQNGQYRLLREDIDQGVIVSESDFSLFLLLYKGLSIDECKALLNMTTEEILEFCAFLVESKFVKKIGIHLIKGHADYIYPQLYRVPQKFFTWIYSLPAFFIVVSIIGIGFLSFLLNPAAIPNVTVLFWHSDYFFVFLSIFLLGNILTFFHEIAHYCVTRAVGGQARIKLLSYRGMNLVMETESYGLLFAEKRKLYSIYFAGILFDLCLVAICFIIIFLNQIYQFFPIEWIQFFQIIIILELSSILWQFQVTLQTDVYNAITEYLDEPNIFFNALDYLSKSAKNGKNFACRLVNFLVISRLPLSYVEVRADPFLDSKYFRRYRIFLLMLFVGTVFYLIVFFYYEFGRDLLIIYQALVNFFSGSLTEIVKAIIVASFILFRYIYILFNDFKRIRTLAV